MDSSIEAEMARFEEEISTATEEVVDEFKPPPLPPVMPPIFLPHALQSSKENSAKNKTSNVTIKEDGDFSSIRGHTPEVSGMNIAAKPSGFRPGPSSHGSLEMRSPVPGPGGPNNNLRFGPMGPRPFSSGPMRPNTMLPGIGPRIPPGPIGPGPMIPGPMGPPGMMIPNPRIGPPVPLGMNGPNPEGMRVAMPPPMPTFFPPPALPDFGNISAAKKQQTVYSAAPVLKKKNEERVELTSANDSLQASSEKASQVKKEIVETSKPPTVSKSDDRLSEVGPEAGPHIGLPGGSHVPVMMPPAAFGQPALYGLSPLAGNPEMVKAAAQVQKKKKIIRTAAGQKWEDQSLQDWDTNDYRLFCGDLGNEVTDDTLARVFSRYSSFQKARVVRDKNSKKTKGYGFVSFKDPNDFIRAMREINGKYVGNRPIKLRKSNWKDRNIDIVRKKVKEKKKLGYKV